MSAQLVIQVGFDPAHDSTGVLRGDRKIRTILDVVRKNGDAATDDFIVRGFKGVLCMEAAPLSNHAYIYRRLARQIVENLDTFRPRPLSPEGLKSWARVRPASGHLSRYVPEEKCGLRFLIIDKSSTFI